MVGRAIWARVERLEMSLTKPLPIYVHFADECDTAKAIEYIGQVGAGYSWRVPYDLMDDFPDEVSSRFPDSQNIVITVVKPVTNVKITYGQ
ncbi:hypothetical protein OAP63_10485 [Vibrio sp.]|nr:hypothetical protein [Vibrio sp.]